MTGGRRGTGVRGHGAGGEVFPRLELVERPRIRFHEEPERARTARLCARLREEMLLRNPPIVGETESALWAAGGGAPGRDVSPGEKRGRDRKRDAGAPPLLLLDGANRVSAFAELAMELVPVQVVDYEDPLVELRGWHHLLLDTTGLDLGAAFRALPGVRLRRIRREAIEAALVFREVLAVWVDRRMRAHALMPDRPGPIDLFERIRCLGAIIACYEGHTRLERLKLADYSAMPEVLRRHTHELCLYPAFTKEELARAVHAGVLLPTGLTRHLIPGRALGLNFPLAPLLAPGGRDAKEAAFEAHLERIELEGRVRFYEEPVFILNE